ncbi:uncharacterized protein LOC111277079 isoform X2 [Durio zibethinus]|uniref:Uncharacterized protein LOC111277079 isoform X1 n=1 Tax=Durio zibethinus TaxID=66656 RepID=A0A6P5WSB3_DURZI|nr:uncharacterized protein LOC111277079 isoform X1 [Durio zibethinus]XP_022718964.1 uncharacterized protein LOC111277079 isoform X2 [Durio zibethinus]
MDPQGQDVFEVILRVLEIELEREREKTRLMEESLRADRSALEAKERERWILVREKDRMLAVKEVEEKLVADFLEAEASKNFDDQKAMIDAIVASMCRGAGEGNNTGGVDGGYGVDINYLINTQSLDEGTVMATIEGTNGDGK